MRGRQCRSRECAARAFLRTRLLDARRPRRRKWRTRLLAYPQPAVPDGDDRAGLKPGAMSVEHLRTGATTCVWSSLVDSGSVVPSCSERSRPLEGYGFDGGPNDICIYYVHTVMEPGGTCSANYTETPFNGNMPCVWADLGDNEPWYVLHEEEDGATDPVWCCGGGRDSYCSCSYEEPDYECVKVLRKRQRGETVYRWELDTGFTSCAHLATRGLCCTSSDQFCDCDGIPSVDDVCAPLIGLRSPLIQSVNSCTVGEVDDAFARICDYVDQIGIDIPGCE